MQFNQSGDMMRSLVRKIVNKGYQCLYEKTGKYKKQKKILQEVIESLGENNLSDDAFKTSIINNLEKVNKNVILRSISMAEMPFIVYLLSLKYENDVRLVPKDDDCLIMADGTVIARMSYLASYIHFLDIKDNRLYIEGNVSVPTVLSDSIDFEVKCNGENISCNMYDAGLDLKKGSNIYETRTAYIVDMPLDNDINKVKFFNNVNGTECEYGKINSMRFSPVADCIKYQYCVRNGWIVYIENNEIIIERATENEIRNHERLFQEELKKINKEKSEEVISLRNEYFERLKTKNKPIWIFMDRIDRAGDNAEAMFKYTRQRDEVDAYFIIEEGTADYGRLSPLGNIIKLNSREHYLLVLLADYIISSQSNGVVENPFWGDAEFYRDLYHQGKIIFLQHGVTKDDMSITMNKFNSNFYGLITSGVEEQKSFIGAPYFYSEDNIWLTGMPRFDSLYDNSKKYILIMPSWRKGLMEQVWVQKKNAMVWQIKDDFMESEYVKRYSALLCNEKLRDVCNEYGYKLVFMPHALMEPYIDRFSKGEHCVFWDSSKLYRDAFAEGNLLVSDYSSVIFDFAYLGKPVMYYQFDRERFFKEHTYTKGYFDYYKDGFGEVVCDEEEMVELIIDYIKNGCNLKDTYDERIHSFFKYQDRNCCKRVYEHIKN